MSFPISEAGKRTASTGKVFGEKITERNFLRENRRLERGGYRPFELTYQWDLTREAHLGWNFMEEYGIRRYRIVDECHR